MKFLRVDMSRETTRFEDVPQPYLGLGGRGLTSTMINAEVPPRCDPLGPENKLIFAPGILSGTSLVNTSRMSVGAKSPLTGTIKESNAGGTVAAALGRLGITAIIVEGQAKKGKQFILRLDENGEASLLPAQEFKGMRTYSLVDRLLKAYGDKTSVMCIGPAGEYLLKSASIQASDVDGRPCRSAGRGGLGAVMAAKGLKALIVDQRGKTPDAIPDPETFKESARIFAQKVKENPFTGMQLSNFGTAGLVSAMNAMGAFPSYNATKGVLEGWEMITGETLTKIMKERGGTPGHMGCAQCIIHCSNVYLDKQGNYVTSSLEYETIWSFGAMLGINDMDTIARLDFLCDDIGLDTMNTGVAVAVAMDAGYRKFGDAEAVFRMVEEIGQGTEMGKVLGNGPVAVGSHFNHHRVPAVKGQSIAAYDPRAMQGNGVTYATSPMGADHTAGNVIGEYMARKLDPLKPEGQVKASRNTQIAMAGLDSIGLCILAAAALAAPEAREALVGALSAKLGTPLGPDAVARLGIRTLQAEREFNRKAGFTNKDDRLPEFFYKEALPPHNTVFAVTDEELDSTFAF
ncbi:MAG: aldehyde ferredoxin oxidoreductase C-terminal domain-containing protein [Thermodesulfobacteriota bacterium]